MRQVITVSLLLVARAAWAQAPVDVSVDSKSSNVRYAIKYKLHDINASSRQIEGKARLLPTGEVQAMIRIPVASFDSGNVNRDAHMKEAVEAARFPVVELKAATTGVTLPASFPATIEKVFRAKLTFHGVTRDLDLPLKIVFESAERVRVFANFNVSLESFAIERPSLFFIKVDDAMTINAELIFVR